MPRLIGFEPTLPRLIGPDASLPKVGTEFSAILSYPSGDGGIIRRRQSIIMILAHWVIGSFVNRGGGGGGHYLSKVFCLWNCIEGEVSRGCLTLQALANDPITQRVCIIIVNCRRLITPLLPEGMERMVENSFMSRVHNLSRFSTCKKPLNLDWIPVL